jgi:mono/diheme cytochrome c family protein
MNISRRRQWVGIVFAIFLATIPPCTFLVSKAAAADAVLDVVIGGASRHFSRDELLRRGDAARVKVENDIAYGKAMEYRAVPVAALLGPLHPPLHGVIEAVAVDGFAAQLPVDLLMNTDAGKAIAWLAIEPADAPWPNLPGKSESAGPFYIVWAGANVAAIRSEQWPYQTKRLESQDSPLSRWPALDVEAALPPSDPARAGLALYVTQCLPCHVLNGAGTGTIGPDLSRPMNPTRYMTREGLHALIRDPKSVRAWPGMQMPGFAPEQMSDKEIDEVIAYLAHMAARRMASP